MPVCSLLLVQVFYDPFSEADSHTRVEMNTELQFSHKTLSFDIGPRMVCGNTVVDMWECM